MTIHGGKFIGALALTSLLASGCASLEPVPLQHSNQAISRPDVKVGEAVVVTKTDGAKQKFTVTAVEDDALVGRDVRVPYAQMSALDVQRGNQKHTGLIIGAVVLGAAAIAAAASGGGGGGGY